MKFGLLLPYLGWCAQEQELLNGAKSAEDGDDVLLAAVTAVVDR